MTLARTTPMRRTSFDRPSLSEAHFAAKQKTCKHCKGKFTPVRAGQIVCIDHAVPYVQAQAAKKREAAKRADRKETKQKLAALHPLSWHKKQAQAAINKWVVHVRDRGQHCISCNAPPRDGDQAGHYRSRGSAPHLALDPRNLNRQCTRCNLHLHGNPIGYRAGLVVRYGESHAADLEADQSPRHYTADDFDGIAAHYRAEWRALEKEMA